jgi:hypothetical protein
MTFRDLQFGSTENKTLKKAGLLTMNAELALSKLFWHNRFSFEQGVSLSLFALDRKCRAKLYLEIDNFLEVI